MSEKRNSCLMRLGIGCISVFVLFVLTGVIIALTLQANKPEDSRFTTLDDEDYSNSEYQPLVIGTDETTKKPIKVYIKTRVCQLSVIPSTEPKVKVTGKYDQANFVLRTKHEDKGDHLAYIIDFDIKGSMWAKLIMSEGEMEPDENKLTLHLPVEQLLDVEISNEIGELDMDLTGLAIRQLDVDFSKGETSISMGTANPVVMERFNVDVEMGDHTIYDLQNYNFSKAKIDSSMGELNIFNSGEFLQDNIALNLEQTMGTARIELPKSSRLTKLPTAMMGESSVGDNDTPDSDIKTTVQLKGGVSLGEYRVSYTTSRPSIVRFIRRRLNLSIPTDQVFEEARQLFKNNYDSYNFDKGQMNALGYRYLGNGQTKEAIEVFKLNVLFNPNYANGYDSLGEGYMKAGETELAILNYEKSLELNPNNFNGKQMLKQLQGDDVRRDQNDGIDYQEQPQDPQDEPENQ